MKSIIIKLPVFIVFFIFSPAIIAVSNIPDVIVNTNNTSDYDPTPTLSSKSPIETITANDIKESNAQTLDQLLQGKFGVQTSDLYSDGNHSNISIRGFGDNSAYNSLIMLDGQPLTNSDLALPAINFIPLNEIEQIDIMPSSGGVLYGDQAVGGVINIITKKNSENTTNIYADYGSFNTRNIGGQISKIKNGFGFGLNAFHYDTDNYREHNNYQTNNINTILSYNSKTTDSYIRYWKINNHMLLPNGLSAEQVAQNRRQASSDIPFNNQDTDFWQFAIKKNLNDQNIINLKAYAKKMTGDGAYGINQAILFNEKQTTYNITPEFTNTFNLLNHSFFPTLGIELNSDEYTYNDSCSKQLEKSLYGQVNTYLTSKLSTAVGARTATADYNLHNIDNNEFNPTNRANATNLEASYSLSKNINIFAKRADSYRFPKTDEQTWTYTGEPLKTQTGTSYETGFNFQKGTLSLLVEIYELDLRNEIMAVPTEDENKVYNENIDPTQRRGVIINAVIPLAEKIKLESDLGYVDAKFNEGPFQGNKIPFVAEDTARIATVYSINKYFEVYLEGIYISSRYPVNDLENIDDQLGGFTVYNLNLNFKKAPCLISFKVNNITNKQYYSYVTTTYTGNSGVSTMYYPAAGINAILSVGISL